MAGRERDDDTPEVPWHNRTSTLLAVSVAGLAAIALVIACITYVAREFSEPELAPNNFVEPAYSLTDSSSSSRGSATPTTTGTITSTSPPVTSDINPDLTPSSTESTTRNTRTPRTKESSTDQTTTSRPRLRTNVTRTVDP